MRSEPVAVRAYRSLVALYPRSFRREYRDDLIQLFRDQCRDEHLARVCLRAALDLALTVPHTHLEARMDRSPNPFVTLLYAAIAVGGLMLAGLAGTEPVPLAIGLALAVAGAALAAVSWRRSASANAPVGMPLVRAWWKVLLAGAVPLSAAMALASTHPDVDGLWYAWIVFVLTTMALTVAGIVLGLVAFVTHRSHPMAA